MENDRIVAVEVEAVAWDRRAATAIEQRRLEVPEDLDVHAVREHLEARFGESTGTVHADDEAFGDIVIGWLFPDEGLVQLEMDHPEATLLAVPFVRFSNGVRRELTIYHAELQARFADLARSLAPDGTPPWSGTPTDEQLLDGTVPEHPKPLASEELQLYHSDLDGLRLELEGWLRRLVAEGHTFLVIEVGDRGRYVQFVTHDGTWLRGEVVGPANLEGLPPLDDLELLAIHAAGWNDPDEGSSIGNFWFEWGDPEAGEPVDVEHAAHLAAITLDSAFGPISTDAVAITTGPSRPPADR